MPTLYSIIGAIGVNLPIFLFMRWMIMRYNLVLREYILEHNWLHPNSISIWRMVIALISFTLYIIIETTLSRTVSIFIYTFSVFQDAVDGLVARWCGLETEWGKWLDPFSDKVTYLTPITYFTFGVNYLDPSLYWLSLLFEFVNQFSRQLQRKLGIDVAARIVGKVKAVFFFSLVIFCATIFDGLTETQYAEQLKLYANYLFIACTFLSFGSIVEKFVPSRKK